MVRAVTLLLALGLALAPRPTVLPAAIGARYVVSGDALEARVDAFTTSIGIADQRAPAVSIAKWGDETFFEMRLVTPQLATSVDYEGAAVVWRSATAIARVYDREGLGQAGGLEFDVQLLARPPTNVVTFAMASRNLTFDYQAPLAHERADGSTWEVNPWGGLRERPANVNGSYAVYHATAAGDYAALGGHNYESGKAFHIYRPWAQDATGRRVWAALDIDATRTRLTITVPPEFLATATYPVLVDPTFGYSGTAASDDNIGGAHILAKATSNPASNGTLDSVTIKGRIKSDVAVNGHPNHGPAIYSDSSGTPNALLEGINSSGTLYTGSDAEVTKAMAGTTSLTSGTQYWLGSQQVGLISDYAGCDAWFKFDASGGTGNLYFKVSNTASNPVNWEATASGYTAADNEKVYIFGTFTASGGATPCRLLLLGVGCDVSPMTAMRWWSEWRKKAA